MRRNQGKFFRPLQAMPTPLLSLLYSTIVLYDIMVGVAQPRLYFVHKQLISGRGSIKVCRQLDTLTNSFNT